MKLSWLLMALLLLPLTSCSNGNRLSDTSTPDTSAIVDIKGENGDEMQSILQEFLSAEDAPLTIALEETRTGRISAYQMDSYSERITYLLSSGQWAPGEEGLPDSPYVITISNRKGAKFEIPSQGNAVFYSSSSGQVTYSYTSVGEGLFDALRFIFDGYEARPQNVSVSDADGKIAERWAKAYQQYLLSTIPGGANELSDVSIVSINVTNGQDETLRVSFDIALKAVNDVGQSWRAGGGYSGEDDWSDYIIAPRVIELEKQGGRWYCMRVLGS